MTRANETLSTIMLTLTPELISALDRRVATATAIGDVPLTTEQVAEKALQVALAEPQCWVCDSCKQPISSAKDGVVEWLWYPERERARGLRLVHTAAASPKEAPRLGLKLVTEGAWAISNCMWPEGSVGAQRIDVPVPHLTGADGLMQLLERVAEGILPVPILLELILRLHLPNYEAARPYLANAVKDGVIRPNLTAGFFWQDELRDAIRHGNPGRL